jgi:hypothetical protein
MPPDDGAFPVSAPLGSAAEQYIIAENKRLKTLVGERYQLGTVIGWFLGGLVLGDLLHGAGFIYAVLVALINLIRP